ncbi:MAG: helix-turn-helix domain-containing protein [Eubacteriales bacterium]
MKEEILYISPHNLVEPFYINIAGISYCDGSYHIYRPKSAVFCMEYIFSGNGTLRYLGKEYHPKEGDVYMLEHGYDHEYFSDAREPWTKIWFNAAGPLVGELVRTYRLNGKAHFPDMNLRADFEKILDFCKGGGKPEHINAQCALIFHEMLQKLYEREQTALSHFSPEAESMKAYLDTHLSETVSVETLSALIYKSRSQAIRIFKKEFGSTPYDYLLENRIKQAKTLLKNTNLRIKDIAYQTGFSDEHYFSDLFRKKTGKTPLSYRFDDEIKIL